MFVTSQTGIPRRVKTLRTKRSLKGFKIGIHSIKNTWPFTFKGHFVLKGSALSLRFFAVYIQRDLEIIILRGSMPIGS